MRVMSRRAVIGAALGGLMVSRPGLGWGRPMGFVEVGESADLFTGLPKGARGTLRERIAEFVSAVSTQNIRALSELVGPYYVSSSSSRLRSMTDVVREAIVSHLAKVPLVEFTPELKLSTPGHDKIRTWTIDGCGHYRVDGEVVESRASIMAYYANKDWFFIGVTGPSGKLPLPCTQRAKE